ATAVTSWNVNVSWGDGTPNTQFTVTSQGSLGNRIHTYAEEGNYTVTVTVTDGGGDFSTASFPIAVSDAAVQAQGVAVTAISQTAFADQLVATFTDPGGAEGLGDYSASIDWGDGQTSAGTIGFTNGVFTVAGSHTYAA